MRVGVLANVYRPGVEEAFAQTSAWAQRDGHRLTWESSLARFGDAQIGVAEAETLVDDAEMILAFGGDGTMLRAASVVGRRGTPILGVNLGSLGFLTQVTPAELPAMLTRVSAGDYVAEARSVLEMDRGQPGMVYTAFNEVTVDRGEASRAIELKLESDDRLVCRYVADGLIVATPTGSTAYALSAGGPVVVPSLRVMVVTPVAAHSLAQRPIIVPDHVVLRITCEEPKVRAAVMVDGQRRSMLDYGESCTLRRADFDLHLVRFPERDFYEVVRTKLHWGVDPRHAHRDDRVV